MTERRSTYRTKPGKADKPDKPVSELEAEIARQLNQTDLPKPVTQYLFHPTRKWRADFAWPDHKLLLEVQGGTWMAKSGHSGGSAIAKDYDKINGAQLAGYRILLATTNMVSDGRAVKLVEEALVNALEDGG